MRKRKYRYNQAVSTGSKKFDNVSRLGSKASGWVSSDYLDSETDPTYDCNLP